jgi:predicted esterase
MNRSRRALIPAILLFATSVLAGDAETGDSGRHGEFRTSLTITQAAGAELARSVESVVPLDEIIAWEFYVPEDYRPEKPPGLMVYISPSPSGKIPRGWKAVLDRHNMIWVAARNSGNRVTVARRAIYALIATALADRRYNIDPERVYLSGFSGGGKVASMVAIDHPHLFKGAIYTCGVKFWDEHPPGQLGLVGQNHYVFVTGSMDHALELTRTVHKKYLESGIANSKLMVIRRMTHKNPRGPDFEQALQYLDSRVLANTLPAADSGPENPDGLN